MKSERLKSFLKNEMDTERSMKSPAGILEKIVIDDVLSQKFQNYYCRHTALMWGRKMVQYMPNTAGMRPESRFRSSKAGVCPQKQAYTAFTEEYQVTDLQTVTEPEAAKKYWWVLAAYAGTFLGGMWQLIFDHLEAEGRVDTVAAEQMRFLPDVPKENLKDLGRRKFMLTGTIDRIVQFEYCEKPMTVILDFKTKNARRFAQLDNLQKPDFQLENEAQVMSYFYLGFKADTGMLLYENGDTHKIRCVDVPYYEPAYQKMQDEYIMMDKWVDQMLEQSPAPQERELATNFPTERVHLRVDTTQCNSFGGVCPFKDHCWNVEHPEILEEIRAGVVGDDVF